MFEMSKWKRNPAHSNELSTIVFLRVTAKGLSCLMWATAEIFLPVMLFCHPPSSLPPSTLPTPSHSSPEHQTTTTSHNLLSPSQTKWLMTHLPGVSCACNPAHHLSWASRAQEPWQWALPMVCLYGHDISTCPRLVYMWAKHASF